MDSRISFEYLTGVRKFDKKSAWSMAQRGAEDGIVLLENKNGALPLSKSEKIAFFGRMQKHYLILGTGSGGRVTPEFTANIFDSLKSLGANLDSDIEKFYDDFVAEHPYDYGNGWSNPASQIEPELFGEFAESASARAETAIYVITRTAGEDCDLSAERGGYRLTETELANLKLLRRHFKKLVVLLNVCGIIDMSELVSVAPDAILLLWQGGMLGGLAAARVLLGEVNPSGRLPDTIATSREDYPAYGNYGAVGRNIYKEDIYVGYRYFATFAPERVIYPFGYGLSYTDFDISFIDMHQSDGETVIRASVANLGGMPGREIVQCYVSAPQGELGKPKRVLASFTKTEVINPGESVTVTLKVRDIDIASFDDSDPYGDGRRWVLEKGKYIFSLGANSRDAFDAFTIELDEDETVEYCESALAPVTPFDRLVNNNGKPFYEPVTLRVEREEFIPEELEKTNRDDIDFSEVAEGKATLEDFVAQLTDEELICLVRGEGMSSPKVTPGAGGAFIGVTAKLRSRGLPILCCTDGPSGIRLVSDAKCVAYPSATCLSSTWDIALVEEMYSYCGAELATHCVDLLLGPGTNIHRDPLCGRNFEYFSEDPLLAGKMAAAVCRGLDSSGVSGVVKHFLANNSEVDRYGADSVISERAIREIYSKPFFICVTEGNVRSVMTSYNPVNGRWTASSYDLTIRLLRNDFGFDGFVMTDWWARVSADDGSASTTNLAAMVHAGNDIYMVTPDAATREDNLASALAEGSLARSELQRSALNLCAFALESLSYRAMRNGYGVRDLRAEYAEKSPNTVCEVNNGEAMFNSASACRAVIKVTYISATPTLTQTNIALNINEKNAGAFVVSGTDGRFMDDYREISLVSGDNKFVFDSESNDAKVTSLEIFLN